MATKHAKAVGRLGVRYGRTIRKRLSNVESTQKGFFKCPSCSKVKVKRMSAGIWFCSGCNTKFAGKAYSFK
jgi:large subunit ribosomal protein L37Ae